MEKFKFDRKINEDVEDKLEAWKIVLAIFGGIALFGTLSILIIMDKTYSGIANNENITTDIYYNVTIEDGELDTIGRELSSKGWILFYSPFCPLSREQIMILGAGIKNVHIVDVTVIPIGEVKNVPTWMRVANETITDRREGVQSLEELQRMTRLESPLRPQSGGEKKGSCS